MKWPTYVNGRSKIEMAKPKIKKNLNKNEVLALVEMVDYRMTEQTQIAEKTKNDWTNDKNKLNKNWNGWTGQEQHREITWNWLANVNVWKN
jgi:hypothetical protein